MNSYDRSPFHQLRRKIVFDVLERFPNHGNLTIAKKLFAENPEYFNNAEHARDAVRHYRGAGGKDKLNKLINKTYVRKPIPTT